MPGDRALTVVTWNLQGRAGLDAAAVAGVLTRFGADVVALQEVQRGQARAVSDRLGADWHGVWGFKHWPVVTRPEGLRHGNVWGTYQHGWFEVPETRQRVARAAGMTDYRAHPVPWRDSRQAIYKAMAEHLVAHVDLEPVKRYLEI